MKENEEKNEGQKKTETDAPKSGDVLHTDFWYRVSDAPEKALEKDHSLTEKFSFAGGELFQVFHLPFYYI